MGSQLAACCCIASKTPCGKQALSAMSPLGSPTCTLSCSMQPHSPAAGEASFAGWHAGSCSAVLMTLLPQLPLHVATCPALGFLLPAPLTAQSVCYCAQPPSQRLKVPQSKVNLPPKSFILLKSTSASVLLFACCQFDCNFQLSMCASCSPSSNVQILLCCSASCLSSADVLVTPGLVLLYVLQRLHETQLRSLLVPCI